MTSACVLRSSTRGCPTHPPPAGGNTTAVCAFDSNAPLYDSRGVAIQQVRTAVVLLVAARLVPVPSYKRHGSAHPHDAVATTAAPPCPLLQFGPVNFPPPATCTDWDTGALIQCTQQCAVIGTPFLQFQLINPNNPTSGVIIKHDAMPPKCVCGLCSVLATAAAGRAPPHDPPPPTHTHRAARSELDPFGVCPPGLNGLLIERSMTFVIACDQSVSDLAYDTSSPGPDPGQIAGLVLYEYPQCSYTVYLRSAKACGVKGDPFDAQPAVFGPATNFGFTVLGAALVIFVSYTYSFGDNRGWWEPIKSRMPHIPGLGSYSSYSE